MSGERAIHFMFDLSDESQQAIEELVTARSGVEKIRTRADRYNWSEPLWYKVPYVVAPEGTFEGLEMIRGYIAAAYPE